MYFGFKKDNHFYRHVETTIAASMGHYLSIKVDINIKQQQNNFQKFTQFYFNKYFYNI
jgi:hypothetical protein